MNKYSEGAVVQISTVFCPVYCYFWKGPLKRDFLDIYLTTFFGVRQFKDVSTVRVIFFWKWLNLNISSENGKEKKNSENIFRFLDNCLWKCCNKLPLLRREYLWSEVSGLNNSPKILHIIKRDFFNLNCSHSDQ